MSDSPQLDEQIDFDCIDSDEALKASCERWQSANFIALDTEFIRTDTFYPIAGLLQVGCLGETALIDPLEIADWSPFLDLLRAPSITKVLHSCSEDFEVFLRLFDCVPTPVLDTQIGAALAGMGVGLSYQKLVMAVLDIHLEKGETRSDWLQRPLTDNQQLYAALDVVYLQQIYSMLVARLQELGRLEWWQQEGQLLVESSSPTPPELSYQRLKSLWKLTPRQQLAARMLCEWRETEARRKDVPRGRILKDPICQEVARRMPENTGALASVKDLSPGVVRRNGDTILSLIAAAKDVPEDELPAPAERPLSREQSQLVKSLRRRCEEVANELALPVEVLTRKRELEAVIRDGELPAEVPLWRRQLLTPCLELANSSAGGEQPGVKQICAVYRSPKKEGMYLYVDHHLDLAEVPEALLLQFGKPERAMTLVLHPERKLARADVMKVMEAIAENGYYLQMPPQPEAPLSPRESRQSDRCCGAILAEQIAG